MNAHRPVELDDVQGLLRYGYKHHAEACFLLLQVRDATAARRWLAQAPVADALPRDPLPPTLLQVAFTAAGLRALGTGPGVLETFAPEFVAGLGDDAARARRLGDTGPSAPSQWHWGGGEREPHVLVLLYAMPGAMAALRAAVEAQCSAGGFHLQAVLQTAERQGFEPFGFADGLSQPELDWQRTLPARDTTELTYRNLACLGEFILGYPNEYGAYTERPLLDPNRHPALHALPRAEEQPAQADLGRNGSYLVIRQLEQDVAGFWATLDRLARGNRPLRQQLAEAMVGRTVEGRPLVPADDDNGFTFRADPAGLRCPLGAHIRRSNPRNADLPPGAEPLLGRLQRLLGFDAAALQQDWVASTRFHRLLRRGRAYAAAGDSARPGLYFIALNANIGRQFEFVQGAWLMGSKFAGLHGEADPLLGQRTPGPDGDPNDGFSRPQADGPAQRIAGLPAFVTVRGGAYCFLPGLRALRCIAEGALT